MIDRKQNNSEYIQLQVQLLNINAELAGQRLDNFLFTRLKRLPKSRIYRSLRQGEVRVNSKRVKASYKLMEGDVVRIPPFRIANEPEKATPSSSLVNLLAEKIVYEDDYVLVIDKPSGVAVHGGDGINIGVIEALRFLKGEKQYLELAHRLDRETSGCLLLAKKRSVLRKLHDLFRSGGIKKNYLALLAGNLKTHKKVSAPLRKNILSSGERMVKVAADGVPAHTNFNVKEHLGIATFVKVQLLTGKTHQIRVHSTHINHPIAGDLKYGDEKFNAKLRSWKLNRLFLHSYSLEFDLPDIKHYKFTVELDSKLEAVLEILRKKYAAARE